MAIQVPTRLMEELIRHAESTLPNECCGILVGRSVDDETHVDRVIQARNITEDDPKRSYQIDWRTLFETVRFTRDSREEMVGFYHSHPDGTNRPSKKDQELAWVNHVYLIVSFARRVDRRVVPVHQDTGCHASRECGSMLGSTPVAPLRQDAPYGIDRRITAWKTVGEGSPMHSVPIMVC